MLKLVKIHENDHLVEQCIALLNDEWPRDKTIRLKSLQKSSDNYPICLALVDEHENVFGFVKLSSELPFNRNIFLESLVVCKAKRSQGLGRFIMVEVEKLVKSSSFGRITLTTIDKEPFYIKMGFSRVFDANQSSQQTLPNSDSKHTAPPPMPSLFRASTMPANAKIFMYKDI